MRRITFKERRSRIRFGQAPGTFGLHRSLATRYWIQHQTKATFFFVAIAGRFPTLVPQGRIPNMRLSATAAGTGLFTA